MTALKKFHISWLCGVAVSLVLSFFTLNKASAYTGLGNYVNFSVSNIRNSQDTANLSQLNQGQQTQAIFKTGTNEMYRGNFSNSVHFYPNQDIYLTLIFTVATNKNLTYPTNAGVTLVPDGGNNQFYTVYDNVDFEMRACDETSTSMAAGCMMVITHNIKLHAVNEYDGLLKVQGASPFRVYSVYEVNAGLLMYAYLFNSENEFDTFRSRFETFAIQNHQDIESVKSYIDGIETTLNNIYYNTNDIKTALGDIYSRQNQTNTKLDTANNLQQQANTDANNRYQDEKDTISGNAGDGISEVEDIDTSISLPNIFGLILGDLSVQTCYDIPTLASFVHSSNTRYCAWFPSSVRTALSALVDVLVLFIICSFMWSWIKKGGL